MIYILASFALSCFFSYSFVILSFAEHLLDFNPFRHFKISASVMDEFSISSSSVMSI